MGQMEYAIPRYPKLSDLETKKLIVKAQHGDKNAREHLINSNLALVYSVTKRFLNRGWDFEDLFQVGSIGLMKAIDKFDLSFNVCFSTYAVPMIMGEIRRCLRDDNPITVSRSLKELAIVIKRTREEVMKEKGTDPTITQLAKILGLETDVIVNALEAVQPLNSIYDVISEKEGSAIYLVDSLTGEHNGIWDNGQDVFNKLNLTCILGKLPERLRYIIVTRYFEDQTQKEVATTLGISQVQVSRLEKQALQQIKVLLTE